MNQYWPAPKRDNERLINSLCELRDIELGSSGEHDKDMIERADYVIDLGPHAGKNGGDIISKGKPTDIISDDSLTAAYLTGKKSIHIPSQRRKGNGDKLLLKGCTGNNLKNVDLQLPFTAIVTGVSQRSTT